MSILISLVSILTVSLPQAWASGVEQEFIAKARTVVSADVSALPVLDRGRIKPLETLSRETLLFLTGRYARWGLDPIQLYLGLTLFDGSQRLEILELREPRLRTELGFPPDKRLFSATEISQSQLAALARPVLRKQRGEPNALTPYEQKVLEAVQQARVLGELISGAHFVDRVQLTGRDAAAAEAAKAYLVALDQRLDPGPSTRALYAAARSQSVTELIRPGLKTAELEAWFDRARLFFWSALAYFVAALTLTTPLGARVSRSRLALAVLALPIALHAAGFAVRVYITGFAPVTSMYGTMIWVALGVAVLGYALLALYRNAPLVAALLGGAAGLLFVTESAPLVISPDMDPIVAVLKSNFWLTIHVLTITSSYAALTITMLIGNAALILAAAGRLGSKALAAYAHAAYRMTQLGVFLLTAGIILGGIWADYSWGRFWGWDPKETWALIADLGFLAVLHARYLGWLDELGLLAACAAAYLLVVMAWYGVNFILATGLHSYGFSSGGATMVIAFVAAQLLILASAFCKVAIAFCLNRAK